MSAADMIEEVLPRPFGKYILLRKLAAGGMAELFLALHKSVGGFEKLVVIKRILPSLNQDSAFIDMLVHEAKIAASFTHTNIAQTFDIGQVDGSYFIAMEHVEGEDIRSIVRTMRVKGVTEFPLHHALSIILGTAAGLAYAHERRGIDGKLLNVVHRDISPQNIIITYAGDVKIVDFGIAKSQHFVEEARGGQLKGKVPYMSPEQARGDEIDWRTDIFALGVLLFELTTGRRLFKGANEYATLKLIKDEPYPLPTQVAPGYPQALQPIVMKALEKNREDRYQSARDLAADLEEYIRDERVPVSTVSLESWMRMLFKEKVEKLSAEISDAKARADTIASLQTGPDSTSFAAGMTGLFPAVDVTSMTSVPSTSAGAASVASIAPPQQKKGSAGILVGGVLAAGAAAAVILYFTTFAKPAPQPAPANTVAADTTPTATATVEAKGAIQITSDPPGAAIWINGDLRSEVTPAKIENLPLGRAISIKLSKEGLESFKQDVTLDKAGDVKSVSAMMKAGSVTVVLDITPEPTAVWVDGKVWKGSFKKIENLSAEEEHKVLVSAPGYVPQSFTINAKQGESKTFKEQLVKGDPKAIAAAQAALQPKTDPTDKVTDPASGPGTVRINSKGGFCNVTVNGAGAGSTPTQASVPAGTVTVTCRPESGPAQSASVKVEPGKTAYVTFQLK